MEMEGLEELSDTFKNALANYDDEGEKFLDRVGNKGLRKVKLRTPVAKVNGGTLRRMWILSKTAKHERTLHNNTQYALHVEYGHRTRLGTGKTKSKANGIKFVEGRYMLTKTIEELNKEFEDELEAMVENLFSK